MITGRTHNVPAQPTTFGKRLAMFGQELLLAQTRLDELIARYPVRGLKGAVGTQLDQLTLLGGRADKVAELEGREHEQVGLLVVASLDEPDRDLDLDVRLIRRRYSSFTPVPGDPARSVLAVSFSPWPCVK